MSDLRARYLEDVRPALVEQFNYRSVMEAPRLAKVTLNMGVGDAVGDRKTMDAAVSDLALTAG